MAGYHVLCGVDNWEDALLTFKHNHKNANVVHADLMEEDIDDVIEKCGLKPGSVDVIIGGPPCQGFSISGKRNPNDPRNRLYLSFVAFLRKMKPRAFVMENVPHLTAVGGGEICNTIVRELRESGYEVTYQILKASDFGVPQNRRRVFFVGVKSNDKFNFPKPQYGGNGRSYITTSEAISDLPAISLNDGTPYPKLPESTYQEEIRRMSTGVFNHETIKHLDKTTNIISMVPDGGNYKNLPQRLWSTRKVNIAWTRLHSKRPSFTIDTGHNHIFHYEYNRVPTARESARIQSFPDKFIFLGKNKASHLKQVGNAVPPRLAFAVAERLIEYL